MPRLGQFFLFDEVNQLASGGQRVRNHFHCDTHAHALSQGDEGVERSQDRIALVVPARGGVFVGHTEVQDKVSVRGNRRQLQGPCAFLDRAGPKRRLG